MTHTKQSTISAQEENPPDERRVAEYLQRHPDFFTRHTGLLTDLIIPHGEGSVVSLVERQVRLLREKSSVLEKQQKKLRGVALLNDRIQERMHRIALQILSATDINRDIKELAVSLTREFDLEHVQLRLFDDESRLPDNIDPALRITNQSARASINTLTPTSRPVCGRLSTSQLEHIFGEHGTSIGSSVVIPLRKGILYGFIAMGTGDKNRFTENMETLYLQRLGEMVTMSLVRLVT